MTLPGEEGAFAVFPRHAPLISILTKGIVKYRTEENKEQTTSVAAGFAEVNANKVTVCVELDKRE